MALIAVGSFVFEVGQHPYEELAHMCNVRWPGQERIRGPVAHQYLGPGSHEITLDGVLYPDSLYTSGPEMLYSLRRSGLSGDTYMVVGGNGDVFGRYTLLNIEIKRSFIKRDGTARKYEFRITLQEYGEMPGALGGAGAF